MSTSHEWAKKLRETAESLESRPDIELGYEPSSGLYFTNKEKFIAAVRALKPGKKKVDENYVRFFPEGMALYIYVDRHIVCKKVQEARWECEPLFSPEEEAEIETIA